MKTNLLRVDLMRRTAWVAIAVALGMGTLTQRASALEQQELAGWWIAIDDTLPKLWKQGAIAPMEEVVQIDADGMVSDRVMNFWAGGAQACFDNKVCSDLPALAAAKLTVSGTKVNFTDVALSDARVDSVAGSLLVRQEAVTATPEWTASLEGQRLTLRVTGSPKSRTLVKIDPDKLRRLYAGMRITNWAPEENWRCFLGNATAGEGAFAPLRTGRSTKPEFLDRYLKFAALVNAVRSAATLPASNETDEEKKKLSAV